MPKPRERQYYALEATLKALLAGGVVSEVPIRVGPGRRSTKGSLRFLLNLIRIFIASLLTGLF